MSDEKYLRREFDSIAKDKSGQISLVDFRRLVFENDSLGGFRPETIDKYLNELSNQTGWINFSQFKEFLQCETNTLNNPLVRMELKLAFDQVDQNNDGFITCLEARKGITIAGQYIPGISFHSLLHQFDDNHDGQLSFQEFLNHINKILSN